MLLGPSPAGRPKISRVNSLNFWPCPEAKVGLEVSIGGSSSPCFRRMMQVVVGVSGGAVVADSRVCVAVSLWVAPCSAGRG